MNDSTINEILSFLSYETYLDKSPIAYKGVLRYYNAEEIEDKEAELEEGFEYYTKEERIKNAKQQFYSAKYRLSKKLKAECVKSNSLEFCLIEFIKTNMKYTSFAKQLLNHSYNYNKEQINQTVQEQEKEEKEEEEEQEEEEEEEEEKYEYPLKVDRPSVSGDIMRVEYRYEGNKLCSPSDMYFRDNGGKNSSGMIYDQSSHYKGEDLQTDKIILRGCKTEAGNKTIDLYYKRKDGVFELEELNITNQV